MDRLTSLPGEKEAPAKTPPWAWISLFIVIAVVYSSVFIGPAEFIGDDYLCIVNNPSVKAPLSIKSLKAIWSGTLKWETGEEYQPLTLTTYAIDHALWGLAPKMFRLTNIFIFFLIGVVAISLSIRLNSDLGGKTLALAASASVLLVVVHPANVEAVAGISHRKELLYVLFGLLSLGFYISRPEDSRYRILSFICMVFAQVSKGSAFVLPVIFLVYEVFYEKKRKVFRALIGLLPFFIVSGDLFLYQYFLVEKFIVAELSGFAPAGRIGGVARTLNFAMEKFFLPLNMAYDYDIKWPDSLNIGLEWVLPLILLASFALLFLSKRYKYLFLLLFILIPLLPYLNIIPLKYIARGQMVFYDHYLLFSTVAASVLLTRTVASVSRRKRFYILIFLVAVAVFLAFKSAHQSAFWKTRETLYKRSIEVSPNLSRPYYFLGALYNKSGRYNESVALLKKAISNRKMNPDANLLSLLGDAYALSGRYEEAVAAYRGYLKFMPLDAKALQNLANALILLGRYAQAREAVQKWLALSPDDPAALSYMSLIEGKIRE